MKYYDIHHICNIDIHIYDKSIYLEGHDSRGIINVTKTIDAEVIAIAVFGRDAIMFHYPLI